MDENHTVTSFNRNAEETFGYAASQVVGKPLDILLPQSSRGPHQQHVTDFALGSNDSRRVATRKEIAGRRKDGTIFPAEAAIVRTKLPDGHIAMTAVLRDLSEQNRMKTALRESEDRLLMLVEEADDAILVGTEGVGLDQVNQAAIKLLGYSRDEFQTTKFADVIDASHVSEVPFRRQELQAGKTIRTERIARRRDGTTLPVRMTTKRLSDGRIMSVMRA